MLSTLFAENMSNNLTTSIDIKELLQAYVGMQNIVDGRSLEERLPSPDQFTLAVVMSIGFACK